MIQSHYLEMRKIIANIGAYNWRITNHTFQPIITLLQYNQTLTPPCTHQPFYLAELDLYLLPLLPVECNEKAERTIFNRCRIK